MFSYRWGLALIANLALLVTVAAHAAGSQPSACADVLDPTGRAREVVQRLGPELPGKTRHQIVDDGELIERRLERGSSIGSLYIIMVDPRTMIIDLVKVDKEQRGRGLSRLLISEAIVLKPEVSRVRATLSWTNSEAFFDALARIPQDERLANRDAAERAALSQTPLFKVLKGLGFSHVTRLAVGRSTIELTAEREPIAALSRP